MLSSSGRDKCIGTSLSGKQPNFQHQGASINDILKIFGFFTPPCQHLELICSMKFTQPPLLRPLFHEPSPPLMRTSYLDAPLSES